MIRQWLEQHEEEGQGLVEYGLILVLVAVTVVVALSILGGQMEGVFQDITGAMNTAMTP